MLVLVFDGTVVNFMQAAEPTSWLPQPLLMAVLICNVRESITLMPFRLNGCYEALEGGNTAEALIDFTGGVSEPLSLDREALRLHSDQRRALFQTLTKVHECKSLITCSIRVGLLSLEHLEKLEKRWVKMISLFHVSQPAEGETVESVLECGLVRGHAYGITAVRKVRLGEKVLKRGGTSRLFMVRMRNPWGTTDWTGAWSQRWEVTLKSLHWLLPHVRLLRAFCRSSGGKSLCWL